MSQTASFLNLHYFPYTTLFRSQITKGEIIMSTPSENLPGQQQAPVAAEADEFSALLKREFKPKSEEANEAVQRAVRTLAQQALLDTKLVSDDAVKTIEKIIAEI